MKKYFQTTLILTAILFLIAGCSKKNVFNFVPPGTAPVLTLSTTTIAPAPSDSDNIVLRLSWTNPGYASDSSTVLYIEQFDTSGDNFAHPMEYFTKGQMWDTATGRDINDLILNRFGLKIGVAYKFEVRLISSYANNDDQKISNTDTLNLTAYKIPPKIPVPANLYIVGDAVGTAPGTGWNNPADMPPYQKFTQIDETTFGGIFNLTGGNSFLLLPLAGNWDHKYGGTSATGGDLLVDGDVPGSNTPAPSTSGYYEIIVNFQSGKYTITPYTGIAPTELFIIGDATPENPQWDNGPNLASQGQQFTQLDNGTFKLTIALNPGGYLFLPSDVGDWSHKFGGASATGGTLLADGDVPGANTPAPAASGTYTITVNFVTSTYTVQ